MNIYKREIVTLLIAALAILTAVGFFLNNLQKEKSTVRTDLYTLITPKSYALLQINRPHAFAKYILSQKTEYDIFASNIPSVLLSIIQETPELSSSLLSFNQQGVVLYTHADNRLIRQIEKNTLEKRFHTFTPQQQTKKGITFHYYPDTGNRFFGYFQYNDIWVASYSRKLLEEVASMLTIGTRYLLPQQDSLRKVLDLNVPLNLLLQTDCFPLSVQLNDSISWKIPTGWLAADLFMNEQHLCYYSSLPFYSTTDSLPFHIGDTLAKHLNLYFPQFKVTNQTTTDKNQIYFTGKLIPQ